MRTPEKLIHFTLQHLMDDTLTKKDGNHIFPHRGSEVFQVQVHKILKQLQKQLDKDSLSTGQGHVL